MKAKTVISQEAHFSLQRIVLIIEKDNLHTLQHQISQAMETYKWLYQNEQKHDILIKVLIKEEFNP